MDNIWTWMILGVYLFVVPLFSWIFSSGVDRSVISENQKFFFMYLGKSFTYYYIRIGIFCAVILFLLKLLYDFTAENPLIGFPIWILLLILTSGGAKSSTKEGGTLYVIFKKNN